MKTNLRNVYVRFMLQFGNLVCQIFSFLCSMSSISSTVCKGGGGLGQSMV